jgi:hypothetical protein
MTWTCETCGAAYAEEVSECRQCADSYPDPSQRPSLIAQFLRNNARTLVKIVALLSSGLSAITWATGQLPVYFYFYGGLFGLSLGCFWPRIRAIIPAIIAGMSLGPWLLVQIPGNSRLPMVDSIILGAICGLILGVAGEMFPHAKQAPTESSGNEIND